MRHYKFYILLLPVLLLLTDSCNYYVFDNPWALSNEPKITGSGYTTNQRLYLLFTIETKECKFAVEKFYLYEPDGKQAILTGNGANSDGSLSMSFTMPTNVKSDTRTIVVNYDLLTPPKGNYTVSLYGTLSGSKKNRAGSFKTTITVN